MDCDFSVPLAIEILTYNDRTAYDQYDQSVGALQAVEALDRDPHLKSGVLNNTGYK